MCAVVVVSATMVYLVEYLLALIIVGLIVSEMLLRGVSKG